MKRIVGVIVSIRTTAALLVLLALLLLVSLVAPPSAAVFGLSSIATSPVFVAVLALFYVNLVAVLIDRAPRTFARTRVKVPSPEAADRWLASPKAIAGQCGEPLDGSIATILRGFGFKPYRVAQGTLFAVKHRHAALGFLVFHAAFFFLASGGVAIWYTRYVGETRAVEGQRVDAATARVIRLPKVGGVPPVTFDFDRVDPTFDRGEATDLHATLRFGGTMPAESRVNHPAKDGAVRVLVNDIGIAPVLWLQDSRGFGVDRVAVPADRRESVEVPLAGGAVRITVLPKLWRRDFPSRESLRALPVDVVVRSNGRDVFRGVLRPGEGASFAGGRVVLQEVRYWAGLRIVSERGGVPLITGFVLLTTGAIWRLLLHRRDVVVAWNGADFRLAGHGEWFADRDRRELMELCAAIERFTAGGRRTSPSASGAVEAPDVAAGEAEQCRLDAGTGGRDVRRPRVGPEVSA